MLEQLTMRSPKYTCPSCLSPLNTLSVAQPKLNGQGKVLDPLTVDCKATSVHDVCPPGEPGLLNKAVEYGMQRCPNLDVYRQRIFDNPPFPTA